MCGEPHLLGYRGLVEVFVVPYGGLERTATELLSTQSGVENEHYSVTYLIAPVHSKVCISELPLRAGLIRAT